MSTARPPESMRRRQVVATLLTAGSAGCATTPSPTPSPPEKTPGSPGDGSDTTTRTPLAIPEFATAEGADGDLVVELTVHNPGGSRREAELLVTATYGDTVGRATRDVALAPGERTDLSVSLSTAYAEWQANGGSLDFSFEYR